MATIVPGDSESRARLRRVGGLESVSTNLTPICPALRVRVSLIQRLSLAVGGNGVGKGVG